MIWDIAIVAAFAACGLVAVAVRTNVRRSMRKRALRRQLHGK